MRGFTVLEYMAGFAVHRIRQKAYRLTCGIEKSTNLELVSALMGTADESTSTLINCQQRGGCYLCSVVSRQFYKWANSPTHLPKVGQQ